MMTYSMVIIDDGITNALQTAIGRPTAAEYDLYYDFPDTDDGIPNTHGDGVYLTALSISTAYDVIDLKVASAAMGDYINAYTEQALDLVAGVANLFNIVAVNMSFGGYSYPVAYADEISLLASRGILTVAAAGSGGSHSSLESALYPGLLSDVITVGSHDGLGNPSAFSQNGPGVDILADGETVITGTSFAAPQVTATVTHVQAIVEGLTDTRLSVGQMIDALQLGGAGPRSNPDPADGTTRYFLHDHAGTLDYAWFRYGGTPTKALEYVASHTDLSNVFGVNANAGRLHYEHHGSVEDRSITFDGLEYIASYGDLIGAFGTNAYSGASHYIAAGRHEGRQVSFDGLEYIASYGDLIGAFGANEDAGSAHFILNGRLEGRGTSFDGLQYVASHGDLILAFGANCDAGSAHYVVSGYGEGRGGDTFDATQYLANYADLRIAFGADEEAATQHFILSGYFEGRTDDAVAAASDFMI